MAHVVRLGPLPTDTGEVVFSYAALDPELGVLCQALSDDDVLGINALREQLGGGELRCEPSLSKAADALGLALAPLPDSEAMLKSSVAVLLAHGPRGLELPPELWAGLAVASRKYLEAAPWRFWALTEPLSVKVEGAVALELELMLTGPDYQNGVLIFSDVEEMLELKRAGFPAGRKPKGENLSVAFCEGPAYAREALTRSLGMKQVPQVLCYDDGRDAPGSPLQLRLVTGVLNALAELTPSVRVASAVEKAEVGRITVTVRAPPVDPNRHPTDPHTLTKAKLEQVGWAGQPAFMDEVRELELAMLAEVYPQLTRARFEYPLPGDPHSVSFKQLFTPWLIFHFRTGELTAAQRMLRARRKSPGSGSLKLLEALDSGVLSIWRAVGARGAQVSLVDEVTGAAVTMTGPEFGTPLGVGQLVLARIFSYRGEHHFSGTDPRALSEIVGVRKFVQEQLENQGLTLEDVRKRRCDPASLLMGFWHDAHVSQTDEAERPRPFGRASFAPEARETIISRLTDRFAIGGRSGEGHLLVPTGPAVPAMGHELNGVTAQLWVGDDWLEFRAHSETHIAEPRRFARARLGGLVRWSS